MLYIFLGAPGSGKGTISDSLVNQHGFKHISTGDIFRKIIASCSELGNKVKNLIESGNLVDDSTTWEVAKTALDEYDLINENVIIDGYPRNINQGQKINEYMIENNLENNIKAIFFEVGEEILLQRLAGRLMCKVCGRSYNKFTIKPQEEGKCDKDGNKLYQREDDKAENVKVRLDTYKEVTEPLINLYKKEGKLIIIDGELDLETITKITLEAM